MLEEQVKQLETDFEILRGTSDRKEREALRRIFVQRLGSLRELPIYNAVVNKYLHLVMQDGELEREAMRKSVVSELGMLNAIKLHEDEQARLEIFYGKYAKLYEADTEAALAFGVDRTDAPPWEAIKASITPRMISLIEKLPEKRLIVVRASRQDLIAAIDSRVDSYGIRSNSSIYEITDDQLWNNGERENSINWQVLFIDGREDIPYDRTVQRGRAGEQVLALQAQYKAQGYSILTGAQAYLGLQMQGLVSGVMIDSKSHTVLNSDVVAADQEALLGSGHCYFGQVAFTFGYPRMPEVNLHLRRVVRVTC